MFFLTGSGEAEGVSLHHISVPLHSSFLLSLSVNDFHGFSDILKVLRSDCKTILVVLKDQDGKKEKKKVFCGPLP